MRTKRKPVTTRWRCFRCGTIKSVRVAHGTVHVWICRNCGAWCATDWSHRGRDSIPASEVKVEDGNT